MKVIKELLKDHSFSGGDIGLDKKLKDRLKILGVNTKASARTDELVFILKCRKGDLSGVKLRPNATRMGKNADGSFLTKYSNVSSHFLWWQLTIKALGYDFEEGNDAPGGGQQGVFFLLK